MRIGIEPGVLEEALVLGRSDGLHQHLGDVVELHHAALFAAGAGEVGDELRLELVLAAGGVVLQGNDLRDLAAGKLDDAGFLVEVGVLPGKISMELPRIW